MALASLFGLGSISAHSNPLSLAWIASHSLLMKRRTWLLATALGSLSLAFTAPPAEAAMAVDPIVSIVVPTGPFGQACAKDSGLMQVTGSSWDFVNYLRSSPEQACYMSSLKFSNFGDLSLLQEMRAAISIVVEPQLFDGTVFSVASIAAFGNSLLPDTTFNYTVSTWSDDPLNVPSLLQWSTRSQGGGDYEVNTAATPSVDVACDPSVVTSPISPSGPACVVPSGTVVESFEMQKSISSWMFMDNSGAASVVDTFVVAGSLPPEGTSPVNPWLPAPPQTNNQPWVFPPVVVTDPGQVRWFDPEVAIGYIYGVDDPSGPLIDQYIAPDLPYNDTYELFSSGGNACSVNPDDFTTSLATITQNVPYDFATPLACFAIKGISEQNALDPLNTLAFVAGLSFDKTGTVTVSQTPIPTPGPLPLAGAGVAYGWARGLRRRLRAAVAAGS